MKLKVPRPHWLKDEKRDTMVALKQDEVMELNEYEQGELIFSLLTGRKMTVADERFIPKEAKYTVLSYISYTSRDGLPRSDGPGSEIMLSAETATPLLIAGLIKPSDPKQWTLKRLLRGDTVKADEPKKNV